MGKLIGPFSNVIDGVINDKFVRNWLDLLSFLLSGEARCMATQFVHAALMSSDWRLRPIG